jgi:hypothetical protein
VVLFWQAVLAAELYVAREVQNALKFAPAPTVGELAETGEYA